jgi:hypothetical protein
MIAMIRRTFHIDRRVAFLAAIGAALLCGAIAARGLFSTRILDGHDAHIYAMRLVEFDANVRSGTLLPRWAPHLGGGHGEPVWVFAPPLMQALAEALHLTGFSFIAAQNAALMILFFFGGAGMFLAGRRLGGELGAAVAAAAFFFAPYVLVQLYVRQSASEFAATMFVPWLFLGFVRRSSPMIGLSIAGIGLAHHIVLLMISPLAVLACAFIGWDALTGCAIGAAISAWSWLPALAEKRFIRIEELTRGYFAFSNHFATLLQVFWSPWGYGYSQPGPRDPLSFTIGPLLIIAAAAGVFTMRRAWPLAAVAAVGVVMSIAISAPLWRSVSLLPPIAFPWRFLVLPSMAIPPLCAIAARRWPAAIAVLVAVHVLWFAPYAHPMRYLPDRDSDYAPMQIASKLMLDTSADEYRPRTAPALLPFSPNAFDPPMLGEVVDITPVRRVFGVFVPRAMPVRFELFAFPGWLVRVDGVDVPSRAASNGLLEFDAPAGRHRVEAVFTQTVDRALADVVSLIGIAALAIRWVLARRGSPAHPQ